MTRERTDKEVSGTAYVVALVVLLVLTGASFGLSLLALGSIGPALALAIAGVKVLVVAFIFMHLSEAVFATKLVGLVAILFIVLLCVGVVADVGLR